MSGDGANSRTRDFRPYRYTSRAPHSYAMLSDQEARQLIDAENERLLTLLAALHPEDDRALTEDLTEFDQHQGDNGHDNLEHWREVGLRQKLQSELDDLAEARGRLDSGSFGRCALCNGLISDERLRALPAARYCRDHSR